MLLLTFILAKPKNIKSHNLYFIVNSRVLINILLVIPLTHLSLVLHKFSQLDKRGHPRVH